MVQSQNNFESSVLNLSTPKCLYASSVTSLPLGVRTMKPSLIRKGSYTSSRVPESSLIAVAIVLAPTGPPLNLVIMVFRILLSMESRPRLSIFSASSANFAIFKSMVPLPMTWAKSLTLLSSEFAILGVPLERRAISKAASSSIPIFRIAALRLTIFLRNSVS